jgi:hypothetical protein
MTAHDITLHGLYETDVNRAEKKMVSNGHTQFWGNCYAIWFNKAWLRVPQYSEDKAMVTLFKELEKLRVLVRNNGNVSIRTYGDLIITIRDTTITNWVFVSDSEKYSYIEVSPDEEPVAKDEYKKIDLYGIF